MKQAKNVKVGDVVQFPHHCFAPMRQGWNGWIFRAAIVERLYTSKKGIPCAVVRYCSRTAGRYQLLPCVEATEHVAVKNLFDYNLEFYRKHYEEFKAYEDSGEPVCWDNDTALLVAHHIF
jgi:hypothetical protein